MESSDPPRARTLAQTPDGLEQRLLGRARAAGFARGDRVMAGFSGGRDSLVLAAAMRRVRDVLGIEPLLIHVDHRLRDSAAAEAAAAMELATALGLPAEVLAVSEPPTRTHPGVGLEEAARRERYRLLFTAAAEHDAVAVVTAHHQADQAETVLLHLLRGGGVHGAAGMAERGASPVALKSDISPKHLPRAWLWRPFLTEPRAEIDAYLGRLGLSPIEDASNEEISLRRNALRHLILPLVDEHFPGGTAALARYGRLAADDDLALDELASAAMEEAVDSQGRLIVKGVIGHPVAVQRRVVRNWLRQVSEADPLSAERTDAVLTLTSERERGKIIELGKGWTVRRERGVLIANEHAGDPPGRQR